MRRMTALLWKEWREQRLMLFAITAIIGFVAIRHHRSVVSHDDAVFVCCAVMGWLLGAAGAGGDQTASMMPFLTAHPVRPSSRWLAKLLLGLASTAAAAVVSVAATWQWSRLSPGEWGALAAWGLMAFGASHYYACWVRSPISAMGLALGLVVALYAFLPLNPLFMYVSDDAALEVIVWFMWLVGIGLLPLARVRFVEAAQKQQELSRRQRITRCLLPMAVFGVVPLLVCGMARVIDVLHFDPSDVKEINAVTVPASGHRVAAFVELDSDHAPWVRGPRRCLAFCISTSDRSVRRTATFPAGEIGMLLWSPDGRYLAAGVHEPRGAVRNALNRDRVLVCDMEEGRVDVLPHRAAEFPLTWVSNERLALIPGTVDSRAGYSIWDARDRTCRPLALPHALRAPGVESLGFTSSPLRIVFGNTSGDGAGAALSVLDAETGRVESVNVPPRYLFGSPLYGGSHMVLLPDSRRGAQPPVGGALLLDLTSGKSVSLDEMLGEPPAGGWRAVHLRVVGRGRWILVLPLDTTAHPERGWHAVDTGSLTATHHGPPVPHMVGAQCSASGMMALPLWAEKTGPGVAAFSLQEPDSAQRVVVAPEGRHPWAEIRGVAWLSDNELAIAVQVRDVHATELRRFRRPLGRAGLLLADIRAKQVRPLWVGRGLDIQWHLMTWREWEDYRR